jgi:large subunit ribosomal protein L25
MSMNTSLSLATTARTEVGKSATKRLRREGFVPVTVYGGGIDATSTAVNRRELAMILRAHGRNTIFTLQLDAGATPVKIADLQLDPVRGQVQHVDLMRISLTEKTEFEITVRLVGESTGVKLGGGILDQVLHEIEVSCLPGDLPGAIEADVSALEIGEMIRVSDLQIDREKIEVLTDDSAVVATIIAPRVEEEVVATIEEPAEPEVIKKGKAEEEA